MKREFKVMKEESNIVSEVCGDSGMDTLRFVLDICIALNVLNITFMLLGFTLLAYSFLHFI